MSGVSAICICTHCGLPILGKRTKDDVFPLCISVPGCSDRKIKVYSHQSCNNHSAEGYLASFIGIGFDKRIGEKRLKHFHNPKGKKEFKAFVLGTYSLRTTEVYITDPETEQFKKMYQGLKRHLLRDRWTYVSREQMQLWAIRRIHNNDRAYRLPMQAGRANPYQFLRELDGWEASLTHSCRGWRFGYHGERWLLLHYKGPDNPHPLVLACQFAGEESSSKRTKS
jgi:hypothetical protein